ncbi:MAG: aryl-sulfate sulfotransferase [Deltaproteobacteria bacterium]|nr:aryl-sulfate sulfotransferase [Deltaproteobacteria bacterium]
MKKILTVLTGCLCITMSLSFTYASSLVYGPTELTYYDKDKAYNGYTLWSAGRSGWLIDMEGNLIHKWENPSNLDLYEDGHRVVGTGGRRAKVGGFKELDWDGNVYSEWTNVNRPELICRGGRIRIFNRKLKAYTIFQLVQETIPYEDAIAHGADPDCNISKNSPPSPDAIIEVDRQGNIVWEWHFWDHIIQNYDPTKLSYGDPSEKKNWGKLDINVDTNTRNGLQRDWNHINSIDYNENLDLIAINSREHGEFYVIDHGNTFIPDNPEGSIKLAAGPKGDFIYRWGNPANYGLGDPPKFNNNGHEQLFGPHNIQWIKPGLPGAGHFLIFENGCYRPSFVAHSSVFEINPYKGPIEKEVYLFQHEAGYTYTGRSYGNLSNQVVWKYSTVEANEFNKGMYSAHISGAKRLPNGNTLMCAGEEGHFVEVTGDGEVVWEYVNPVTSNNYGVVKILKPGMYNDVFRAHRYAPDYSGFAGLDLTPKGKITDLFKPMEPSAKGKKGKGKK